MGFLGMRDEVAREAGEWNESELDEFTIKSLERKRWRNEQSGEA